MFCREAGGRLRIFNARYSNSHNLRRNCCSWGNMWRFYMFDLSPHNQKERMFNNLHCKKAFGEIYSDPTTSN